MKHVPHEGQVYQLQNRGHPSDLRFTCKICILAHTTGTSNTVKPCLQTSESLASYGIILQGTMQCITRHRIRHAPKGIQLRALDTPSKYLDKLSDGCGILQNRIHSRDTEPRHEGLLYQGLTSGDAD